MRRHKIRGSGDENDLQLTEPPVRALLSVTVSSPAFVSCVMWHSLCWIRVGQSVHQKILSLFSRVRLCLLEESTCGVGGGGG